MFSTRTLACKLCVTCTQSVYYYSSPHTVRMQPNSGHFQFFQLKRDNVQCAEEWRHQDPPSLSENQRLVSLSAESVERLPQGMNPRPKSVQLVNRTQPMHVTHRLGLYLTGTVNRLGPSLRTIGNSALNAANYTLLIARVCEQMFSRGCGASPRWQQRCIYECTCHWIRACRSCESLLRLWIN